MTGFFKVLKFDQKVRQTPRLIYKKLKTRNSTRIEFEDEFYKNFSKPLAALESKGFIKGLHSLGHSYQSGIEVTDPTYIMYLCAIAEEAEKMQTLIDVLENAEAGTFLRSKEIDVELPLPVFRAVFKIYESKGYGMRTTTVEADNCSYLCKA